MQKPTYTLKHTEYLLLHCDRPEDVSYIRDDRFFSTIKQQYRTFIVSTSKLVFHLKKDIELHLYIIDP